ncbi:MAG: hypothetical protein ACTSPB_02355 [Candidatus Thorarchaeota archaeon]
MKKRIDFEIKYIGWNVGATRIERNQRMCDIEILELKIDGVDVLPLIKDSIKSDTKRMVIKK